MAVVLIDIAQIERDMQLQPRATLHRDWIEEYAQDMQGGAMFPAVTVFFDGEQYWLADGFHRSYAAEAAGAAQIAADVREGTRRDALLFALGANAEHGHRRTNEDKRRSIDILLADEEWSRKGIREIARHCGVDHKTVAARREAIWGNSPDRPKPLVTRGGTTYEMDVGNIGRSSDGEELVLPLSDEGEPTVETEADAGRRVEPFDWAASQLRNAAMDAIRTLADLPIAEEVLAAWMKSSGYGEPMETLEKAAAWLAAFCTLYREAEPRRWARVNPTAEQERTAHAAQ
jgi:hypothetical protein